MRIAAINFQLSIYAAAQSIVWNHSADSALDQQFGMPHPARPDILRFVATYVSRKTHERFLFFFLSGEPHFLRIDDDDKVACIDVWRENGLFFAAQQIGRLYRDFSKDLVARVDEPPFARDFVSFGGKRFHTGGKGAKPTERAAECQIYSPNN
jgi:hypothetical protein